MGTMMAREALVECARGMIGTPFLHRGRTSAGLDCAGLVIVAWRKATGRTEDVLDYPERPNDGVVSARASSFAERIRIEDAGPGDVLIMRFGGESSHLGILTDDSVIHSSRPYRGVVEQKLTSAIRKHVVAGYRLEGIEPWRK